MGKHKKVFALDAPLPNFQMATNLLKEDRSESQEIPEQAIMQLTGHKSVQGVRAYKKVNEKQQLNTLNTLINITVKDNLINDDDSKSQIPLKENSLSLNSYSLDEIPIFHNCTLSNVNFYIQK
nr:527_t:CDS:2 [Entrophospora candida]